MLHLVSRVLPLLQPALTSTGSTSGPARSRGEEAATVLPVLAIPEQSAWSSWRPADTPEHRLCSPASDLGPWPAPLAVARGSVGCTPGMPRARGCSSLTPAPSLPAPPLPAKGLRRCCCTPVPRAAPPWAGSGHHPGHAASFPAILTTA